MQIAHTHVRTYCRDGGGVGIDPRIAQANPQIYCALRGYVIQSSDLLRRLRIRGLCAAKSTYGLNPYFAPNMYTIYKARNIQT